jgi:hypothetical protein
MVLPYTTITAGCLLLLHMMNADQKIQRIRDLERRKARMRKARAAGLSDRAIGKAEGISHARVAQILGPKGAAT